MLHRVEIDNFFSIRDAQVIDLSIALNVPDEEGRYSPVFPGSKIRAPKVIAIYGANASGKTTVLRALQFLTAFARDSARQTGLVFPCQTFNDEDSISRPVKLAVEFGGLMDLSPAILERAEAGEKGEFGIYRYELEVEVSEGNTRKVLKEALRQRPGGRGKWQRVFERDADGKVKDSHTFSLRGFGHLLNTLQPNVSLLSSFALFQHPTAMLFIEQAEKIMLQMSPTSREQDQPLLAYLQQVPVVMDQINRELNRIDVGVEGMRVQQLSNGPQLVFRHSGLQAEMPWSRESHGTQSFIRMFPLISYALQEGSICLIDELDASLHPLVLFEIVGWFYDQHIRNKADAQLWFTCHSVSLLETLNKEEVIICEKDRQGRTTAHSLMDVHSRRDDNLYRKYLNGAFGGIPQVG
ncbi:ATP/GTP-binding protein [Aestuariivirga sp.]|uniref:AAA family ATPase n=1 Tax=Aestuariivirga sp. TaxID=2650926 RepID=UPI0025C4869C|nr:ATP-binding protein [Aestuariivirga sp.]MCA3556036.1 AAA family ATPase [Aestuariivirga sp.]